MNLVAFLVFSLSQLIRDPLWQIDGSLRPFNTTALGWPP